jgi:hydrogenase-4 membrane subunit HyfE
LLIRATLVSSVPVFKLLDRPTENEKREAMQMWRKREGASVSQAQGIATFVFLLSLAFFTSFQIIPGFASDDPNSLAERIGLAVSLALHLVGLYNMVVKGDIISQVIGLLVMDHGLYLAVVKIVAIPVPAAFFVVSLYFYTLITVFILVFLLPQVRRLVGIDLDEIAQQSKLEG